MNSKSVFRSVNGLLFLGLLSACSHLAYQPTRFNYLLKPEQLDSIREVVTFKSTDGVELTGWYFKARHGKHKGSVVQFHGNGQNLTTHFMLLAWVIDEGYDFFTFDYRGYGTSEGSPSQEGLNRDALAAIDWIMHREAPEKDGKPDVILYGQSLGGAVLMRAFQDVGPSDRARVKSLVIESSFYNYKKIAVDILSRSWISFLFQPLGYLVMSNAYSPEDAIPKIAPTPLLVIHGDRDSVIPLKFGKKIFELAKEPKQFLLIPGGVHINAMFIRDGEYRKTLLSYLDDQTQKLFK